MLILRGKIIKKMIKEIMSLIYFFEINKVRQLRDQFNKNTNLEKCK